MTATSIDIVMTPCNAAWSLPETLASMAAQAVRDIRPIVVGDGSTDETPLILARAAADPRILVLTEPNGEIVGAVGHRTVFGSGFRTH